MSDLVRNPNCWFSHEQAHIKLGCKGVYITLPHFHDGHLPINVTGTPYSSDEMAVHFPVPFYRRKERIKQNKQI